MPAGPARAASARSTGTPSAQEFRDRCDGTVVPADGAGLLAYTVTVTENGQVVIDFKADPTDTTVAGS